MVFTYLAFFFSISATFSSLLLTDELGELHVRASHRESKLVPLDSSVIYEDPSELLNRYGARKVWRPVMWHCTYSFALLYVASTSLLLFIRVPHDFSCVLVSCWTNAGLCVDYAIKGREHCNDMRRGL